MQIQGTASPHSLLSDYLFHLERGQWRRVAEMYHPAAQIHFGDKVHKGAAAITHELTRLGAKFSAVTLQSLFVVDQWPDRIEFETEVEGRFGRMLIHHLWHVHAGKVRQHDASVVAYRRAAEQLPA